MLDKSWYLFSHFKVKVAISNISVQNVEDIYKILKTSEFINVTTTN